MLPVSITIRTPQMPIKKQALEIVYGYLDKLFAPRKGKAG